MSEKQPQPNPPAPAAGGGCTKQVNGPKSPSPGASSSDKGKEKASSPPGKCEKEVAQPQTSALANYPPAETKAGKRRRRRRGKKKNPDQIAQSLQEQQADENAKKAGARDADNEDIKLLKSLEAKEKLDNFQQRVNLRWTEYEAKNVSELVDAELALEAAQIKQQKTIDNGLSDAVLLNEMAENKMAVQYNTSTAELIQSEMALSALEWDQDVQEDQLRAKGMIMQAELIQAQARLLDARVSKNEPTNVESFEVWSELSQQVSSSFKVTYFAEVHPEGEKPEVDIVDKIQFLAARPSADLKELEHAPDPNGEETLRFLHTKTNSQWIDYLSELGPIETYDLLPCYDSFYRDEVKRVRTTPAYIHPCYGQNVVDEDSPSNFGELIRKLDFVKLCDLPVESYLPAARPCNDISSAFKNEFGSMFGRSTMFDHPGVPGIFSRVGSYIGDFATRLWHNSIDKATILRSLELMAIPVRKAKLSGDNRPHLDRTVKAADSIYLEYRTFVLLRYSDGRVAVSIHPEEFGLTEWSEFRKRVHNPCLDSEEFPLNLVVPLDPVAPIFKTLLVDTSLCHEIIQRKTLTVASSAMKLERAYRMAESSEVHQEMMANLLRTGTSSYKDTLQFCQSILLNRPYVEEDF